MFCPVIKIFWQAGKMNNRYAVISGVCFATLRVAYRKLQALSGLPDGGAADWG
jgi:hypothetical protein